MRAVGLLLLWSTVAHADDPRELFGFGKRPAPAADPLDCSDGTAFGCALATDPLADTASPYALSTWLPARYLLRLPVAAATHDAVAHFALGASRDEAGPLFAGATGLENRWTIEGAPSDGVRTGAADTRVPLVFLDGLRVTAGGFTARDRASTGGTIEARLVRGTRTHELDARAYLGWSSPLRQRPIVPNTYFVRRGAIDLGPDASASLVATGPADAVLDGAWYAAGIAPELDATRFTWTTATITDRDGDGAVDGLPGLVSTETVARFSQTPVTYRVPVLVRAGLDRGAHAFDLALVGAAASDARYLFNSTLQAAGVDGRTITGDAIATWRGRWKHSRARAQLAWHRSSRRESARDPRAADIPQLLTAYVPAMLTEDPALAAACADDVPTDRYPTIANCPVPTSWLFSGGAGPLTDATGDRPSITADLAHRIGANVIRIGATGEDTRFVSETRFTGGSQIRSLFPGHTSERQFADPSHICSPEVGEPCPTVDASRLRYRTRYTAAYVEDTWHAAPDITVDGGLRWELMWVGTKLHFSDQLAPRLGLAWDPLGGGRSRVWASMGRSFAMLPAGLGATILQRERTVDRILSSFGEGRSVDPGAVIAVAPGVEPITQDELTCGAQLAIARAVRLTTWLQGRWLRRALDTTTHGFDNPGRHGGTAAVRETGLGAVELATAPTSRLVLRAGYQYGRTIGSWTGAFDPRQGAVLYAGTDYDASSVNLLGPLPTDIGHRTYVEAARTGRVGDVELGVSMRLTAGSGRPRSAIADSDDGVVFLIPRGSAGRGPLLTQANFRLAATWRGFDLTLDLFNVFNRREATNVDELYAGGAVQPIAGGEVDDLVFLKTETSASASEATRLAGYALPTAFQAPFAAVVAVHRAL